MIGRGCRRHVPAAIASLFLFLCLVPSGCDSGPEIASTRGTVSVKGAKLAHGHVLFTPIGGGQYGVGEIQPDGSFVVSTFEKGDGAVVGDHNVQVAQRADDLKPGEQGQNFTSPAGEPFVVESGVENVFNIDIDPAKGWQPFRND
jgi:hypothetical protein